jgi:predicted lipoprotein with Yx(FWY)xxD motif
MLTWLLGSTAGPATVTLPVGWTADVLAGAARRWFRRFRQTDEMCRLVHAATGTSVDLTRDELDAVRRLLVDQQTWVKLGKGPVEDLATWIADFLPPRDGRTADDSLAAALVITRGLLEFTVTELEPRAFQKVLLARLMRMETGQASALDKALFDFHSDLVARLDPDWVGQLQALRYSADAGPHVPGRLDRPSEGSEDVISQVAWRPSRKLLLRGATLVIAGLSLAALLLLAFTVAGAGGAKSASAVSLRIVKIGSVSVLANGQGFTVYWFAADTATRSECNGLCTAYWPPVKGPLTAGTCLTRRLGTITRSDGVTQATYDGHPLYTYVGDSAPGQARGGAPSMNGGPWREITYPAKPSGCLTVKAIQPQPRP